ncbi:MAG: hypothetical protein RR655_08295, partial [Raoultibacter sp.]
VGGFSPNCITVRKNTVLSIIAPQDFSPNGASSTNLLIFAADYTPPKHARKVVLAAKKSVS